MSYILGLSFDFHDSAAALIKDGVVVAAGIEERFSRDKHDSSFPRHAIDYCLKAGGVTASDLEMIAYYELPILKFDRILWCSEQSQRRDPEYLDKVVASWLRYRKFDIRERIAEELGVANDKINYVNHHLSHMGAAFYCSGFDEATIVTMDGVGEFETTSWGVGKGLELKKTDSVSLPHSIGLFYSALTAFLGFEVNEGEYKVMGMAAFGEPVYYNRLRPMFELHEDGGFSINTSFFEFLTPKDVPYTGALIDLLGQPRDPKADFATLEEDLPTGVAAADAAEILSTSKRYADIAASVQKVTEEVIFHVVDAAVRKSGLKNVCLAGGVALNSLANGRLIRERGYALYVHPAAGDSGSAIGAGLFQHYKNANGNTSRQPPLTSAYLGSNSPVDAEIDQAISDSGYQTHGIFSPADLVKEVARLLADGHVIGWFQGKAEWGPRALGHRSILADPTRPDMKKIVNERIKFREPFRPFAPAVLAEEIHEHFDCPPLRDRTSPEYFMLAVHHVLPTARSKLPAITHADGTARLQAVDAISNSLFYSLLQAFKKLKGVGVLMNTSFNLKGEPIVDTPADALRTFSYSGLDYVVIGDRIVSKEYAL